MVEQELVTWGLFAVDQLQQHLNISFCAAGGQWHVFCAVLCLEQARHKAYCWFCGSQPASVWARFRIDSASFVKAAAQAKHHMSCIAHTVILFAWYSFCAVVSLQVVSTTSIITQSWCATLHDRFEGKELWAASEVDYILSTAVMHRCNGINN